MTVEETTPKKPKVFISYSWGTEGHREKIKEWAERLCGDGVDVVADFYELKLGHDKYAFMERMVTDPSVTHVLMFCDREYQRKADDRAGGVGTEAQIISPKIYEKTTPSKFVPILCEMDEQGNGYTPAFLSSKIYIDFTSDEKANSNWEQLIRHLYGQPIDRKPALGKPPRYLEDETAQANPAVWKFQNLQQAVLHGKAGIAQYRDDFLDACFTYADSLRVRKPPEVDDLGAKIVADCGQLKSVRDLIVDWVLLEARAPNPAPFQESLLSFLERSLELKACPAGLNSPKSSWFDAHAVFLYELFLYVVAALLKANAFQILHEVLTHSYLQPAGLDSYNENEFVRFECFWDHSETLHSVFSAKERKMTSPAAELIKRQADRNDIKFHAVIEAELVVMLMAVVTPEVRRWFPATTLYTRHSDSLQFFVKATRHKDFQKLALITGIDDAAQLRAAFREGKKRLQVERWPYEWSRHRSWEEKMNLDKLDTIP